MGTLVGCTNLVPGRRCEMCPPAWQRQESDDYRIDKGSGNVTCEFVAQSAQVPAGDDLQQPDSGGTGGPDGNIGAVQVAVEEPQYPEVKMQIVSQHEGSLDDPVFAASLKKQRSGTISLPSQLFSFL